MWGGPHHTNKCWAWILPISQIVFKWWSIQEDLKKKKNREEIRL